MNLRVSEMPGLSAGHARVRFVHMRRDTASASPSVGVSLSPDGTASKNEAAWSEFRAGVGFLIDSAFGTTSSDEIARMIGSLFFSLGVGRLHKRVEVTLGDGQGLSATARLLRPDIRVEDNQFGTVHVVHEVDALGLYLLEIAPGGTIPAHFHRVMEESEMVLDPGILQQNLRVRPGESFSWPAGYVHEYRNPTAQAKRILCIDRPKFIPEDEVVVTDAPLLVPLRPEWNYFS